MCNNVDITPITFPVRIYVTDLEHPGSFYDKWNDMMPPERKERAGRFKMETGRKRCIMAYALLVNSLMDLAADLKVGDEWKLIPDEKGLIKNPPAITYSPDGKPHFTDIPVHFNISHAGDRVIVALSPCRVGCDVEIRSKDALKIAKRFFTDAEYEMLRSTDDECSLKHKFTRLWTLKESVVKCCGEGIRHEFNDFSLVDENGKWKNTVKLDSEDDIYHIKEYESENGYCYSCCSVYDVFEDEIRKGISFA